MLAMIFYSKAAAVVIKIFLSLIPIPRFRFIPPFAFVQPPAERGS
jgi:hypothetical protein